MQSLLPRDRRDVDGLCHFGAGAVVESFGESADEAIRSLAADPRNTTLVAVLTAAAADDWDGVQSTLDGLSLKGVLRLSLLLTNCLLASVHDLASSRGAPVEAVLESFGRTAARLTS